ncbi:MAG: ExbD/TolR family protein [Gammaproteobacteria bacterium]
MRFYARSKEPLSLNVTPLIDVVFLLLIFFMTSTTFLKETALEISLPSLHVLNEIPAKNTLRITVSRQGAYHVNDEALPNNAMATLSHALAATQAFDANTVVLIAADAHAPYQSVMRAMDAAGKLGYGKIQLQGDYKGEE